MSGKIDVVLLQAVKGLGQKNDLIAVSIAYAKNVLFPKGYAKIADALAKNNIAQKKEQEKKHTLQVSEIRESLELYNKAQEPLIIKRKITPSGGLYEKVHETDVKESLSQWKIYLPADIVLQKQTWETTGPQTAVLTRGGKKMPLHFTIKETM